MPHKSSYALDRMWLPILKGLNVSVANVLRRAHLPDDLFSQSNIRLDPEEFYRLWDGIEKELQDETFPITIFKTVKAEFFSPPLFAALCSPNFLTAIERIAHYKALVAPMRLNIKTTDDNVTLDLVWQPDANTPPASFIITELLFFVFLARIGTYEAIKPLKATTVSPPKSQTAFSEYLGVKIQRGPNHQLVFAKEDALKPFLTASDDLWKTFEPHLRHRLSELNGSVSSEERVHSALLEGLPSGITSIEAIAKKLAVSKRSLQRQLSENGTTFANVLQTTRQKLAVHYLTKSDLTNSEIAFLLGFTEDNSFYRAFRNWTGQTPDTFRKNLT